MTTWYHSGTAGVSLVTGSGTGTGQSRRLLTQNNQFRCSLTTVRACTDCVQIEPSARVVLLHGIHGE
jgi:hypothetical protein